MKYEFGNPVMESTSHLKYNLRLPEKKYDYCNMLGAYKSTIAIHASIHASRTDHIFPSLLFPTPRDCVSKYLVDLRVISQQAFERRRRNMHSFLQNGFPCCFEQMIMSIIIHKILLAPTPVASKEVYKMRTSVFTHQCNRIIGLVHDLIKGTAFERKSVNLHDARKCWNQYRDAMPELREILVCRKLCVGSACILDRNTEIATHDTGLETSENAAVLLLPLLFCLGPPPEKKKFILWNMNIIQQLNISHAGRKVQ